MRNPAIMILVLGAVTSATPQAGVRADTLAKIAPESPPCAECPAMTIIPAGHFTMKRKSASDGRPDDDPEGAPKTKPAREVTFDKPFAIGTYPVTRQEFASFVSKTHRTVEKGCYVQKNAVWVIDETKSWTNPGFPQTPRDPVVCVSWNDAEDYVQWLNETSQGFVVRATVGGYRLPTWEEIEYATAGGTTTAFYWGNHAERDRANYGTQRCLPCRGEKVGADRWRFTSPVGSFPPNAFGLYDMAGNVWQWTQSCRADPGLTPPRRCRSQALHGGSWLTNPEYLRTGEYSYAVMGFRSNHIGIRVAQTLN
jgi:formylglycine-generating enzyme required for sulfatase activity